MAPGLSDGIWGMRASGKNSYISRLRETADIAHRKVCATHEQFFCPSGAVTAADIANSATRAPPVALQIRFRYLLAIRDFLK